MNVDVLQVALRHAEPGDVHEISDLLRGAELPVEGVREGLGNFVVASTSERIVAVAGLERHGDAVLLRSVVVAPGLRASGLGRRIAADRLAAAAAAGASDAYLLTTTAATFFAGLGFVVIPRDDVVGPIREAAEFTTLCPDSATVMHRALQETT